MRLDGTVPRALHLSHADHGLNLQKHWHRKTLEACIGAPPPPHIMAGQQAMAVALAGAKAAVLKDADINDAAQRRGPAHSLCAQNNEAVIPLAAMTIQSGYTVNTDRD